MIMNSNTVFGMRLREELGPALRDSRELQLEMNRKLDRLVDAKGLNNRSMP